MNDYVKMLAAESYGKKSFKPGDRVKFTSIVGTTEFFGVIANDNDRVYGGELVKNFKKKEENKKYEQVMVENEKYARWITRDRLSHVTPPNSVMVAKAMLTPPMPSVLISFSLDVLETKKCNCALPELMRNGCKCGGV